MAATTSEFLKIPNEAGNYFFPQLEKIINDFSDSKRRLININTNSDKLIKTNEILNYVQDELDTSAPIVYYPMGGADVQTPFSIFKNSTDVVSQSFEPVGNIEDIVNFVKHTSKYSSGVIGNVEFDTMKDYDKFSRKTNTGGLLPLAIARILTFFRGKIKGIYHFDINDNGEMEFNYDRTQNPKTNAVIEFESNNETKRYWMVQAKFEKDVTPEGYSKFVDKVPFDAQMFKAAPLSWTDEATEIQRSYLIDPAKKRNATVVTDRMIEKSSISKFGQRNWKEANIWNKDYSPRVIDTILAGDFGNGHKVYVGEGKNLL